LFILGVIVLQVFFITEGVFSQHAVERIRQERAAARADAYLAEGKHELEQGRYVRAIRVLSEAIKKGATVEAYKLRGLAYYRTGAYAEAVADLSKLVNSSTVGPSDYVLRGDVFSAQRNYRMAMSDYDTAIQRDPFFLDAYLGRGLAHLAAERYDLAMRDFQVVLRTDPRQAEALINMGIVCMSADLPRSARSFFERAMETDTTIPWRTRIQQWLAQLPDRSLLEEQVGGLDGYLSETARSGGSPGPPARDQSRLPAGDTPSKGVTARVSEESTLRDQNRLQSPEVLDLKQVMETAKQGLRNLSGTVAGHHMGFKWTLQFQSKGRHVSGLLKIVSPNGYEDTHLCKGTFDRGLVDASDQAGYRFQGRVTENLRLIGVITTNLGQSFSVNMPLQE
jgi:tetratricopeptide (TPR) repeat protein